MEEFLTDLNVAAPGHPALPAPSPTDPVGTSPAVKPVPTPDLSSQRRKNKKRKTPWTHSVMRVLLFVALLLTIALYRDLLIPTVSDAVRLARDQLNLEPLQAASVETTPSATDTGLIALVVETETPTPLPPTAEPTLEPTPANPTPTFTPTPSGTIGYAYRLAAGRTDSCLGCGQRGNGLYPGRRLYDGQ